MRKTAVLLALILAITSALPAALADPLPETQYTMMSRQTTDYFGTVSALFLYVDESDPDSTDGFLETWQAVKDLLSEIDSAVSLSKETSDISRFNALTLGQSLPLSPHTANILKTAKEVYAATGGLYDPTVYPLVDLWGFTPRFNQSSYAPSMPYDRSYTEGKLPLPDPEDIRALLPLVDFSQILLTGSEETGYTLIKNISPISLGGVTIEAQLDLGGIAKGYAVDCVMALLRDRGYEYGHFVCGGSSMAFLQNASKSAREKDSRAYQVGVHKPRQGASNASAFFTLPLQTKALSSSGDYSHNRLYDAILYCHIIDPRTGYPINTPAINSQEGIAAVTVTGDNAAYCDALSTALCIMGPEDAIAYANAHLTDRDVILVFYRAGENAYEVVTNLYEGFTLPDEAYILAGEGNENRHITYRGQLFQITAE